MHGSAPVLIRGLQGWWEAVVENSQLIVDSRQQNSMDDDDDYERLNIDNTIILVSIFFFEF